MLNIVFSNPYLTVILMLFVMLVFFVFYVLSKSQSIYSLKKNVDYLTRTIYDLDHQAKLIIKNDVETKFYQEILENKINKLSLLKNIIVSSISILDEDKLFLQINKEFVEKLGFRKGSIINAGSLDIIVNVDFGREEIAAIKNFLRINKRALNEPHLLFTESPFYDNLRGQLGDKDFLIGPIKIKNRLHSVFVVSEAILPLGIRKIEREVFYIICLYLGQRLNNIKLFEDFYHSREELEGRIQERTRELLKSLREIERINTLKSDFVSSVSHELRTPLTSVKGFSSLLVAGKFGKLPIEAGKRLEKIDENVDKLVNIVNALLDISRIESGKTEVNITPHDIVKLIKDSAEFFYPQIKDKKIELSLDLPQSLSVYMDKSLIERVFVNLINNAIKFTPQEGKVSIKCGIHDGNALIAISDTGYGISEDDLENIFVEFYRANNPQTKLSQGSGLGLPLVKKIIDIHKGRIWVESKLDKGTTFYFTLRSSDA